MTRRRINIIDRGTTVVIKGWRGGELAEQAGVRAVFNGAAGGWVADASRLPDLLAYLDYRNVVTTVEVQGGAA